VISSQAFLRLKVSQVATRTLADTGSDSDSNMKLRSPQYRRSVSAKESSVFVQAHKSRTDAHRLFFDPAQTAESLCIIASLSRMGKKLNSP
jgi:hypothetical protein